MKTGFCGTFVISWTQTEVDGLEAPPLPALTVGATWRWSGEAVRVDGPGDVLRLERTDDAKNLRKRAAGMVQRLVGAALEREPLSLDAVAYEDPLMDGGFVVTDGRQSYTVTLIEVGPGAQPLLMFLDELPPKDRELWVVHHTVDALGQSTPKGSGGAICFTPGTQILTPDGTTAIEDLREGDRVQTKDNGAQEIRWIGSRRMSGARLFAMPELRPVRINAGVLDSDIPDEELLVSPDHRILMRGDAAQELFNTPEVLVAARDLVNGSSIAVDMAVRQVTYVHLLFDRHEVLWANGVESESFHPASAALSTLDEEDKARLLKEYPGLEFDPHTYGQFARRHLSSSEAAILNHAA